MLSNQSFCPNHNHPHSSTSPIVSPHLQTRSIYEQLVNDRSVKSGYDSQVRQMMSEMNAYLAQKDRENQALAQENQKLRYNLEHLDTSNRDNINTIAKLMQQLKSKDVQLDQVNTMFRNQNYSEQIRVRNQFGNLEVTVQQLQRELEEAKSRYEFDLNRLMVEIQNKSMELNQCRRKLNQALDAKMKAQEFSQKLMFEMENYKKKFQNQMKQKTIRLQNYERNQQEHLIVHKKEVERLEEKIKVLQDQNKQLYFQSESHRRMKLQIQSDLMKNKKYLQQVQSRLEQTTKYYHKKLISQNSQRNQKEIQSDRKKQFKKQQKNHYENPQLISPKTKISQTTLMDEFYKNSPAMDPHKPNFISQSKQRSIQFQSSHQICQQTFDIFVNCIKQGNSKKINSLVLFIEKFKSMPQKLKRKYKENLSHISKNQIRDIELIQINPELKETPYQVNKWVLQTYKFTLRKYQEDHEDNERELLFLFRLLTIRYRTTYPHKGIPVEIEKQLLIHMNYSILECFKRIIEA